MTNFLKAIWRWLRDEKRDNKAKSESEEETLVGYLQFEIEEKIKQKNFDEYE